MTKELSVKISRLLSLGLRHAPETLNISLDDNGWCEVTQLLDGLKARGFQIDMGSLVNIVESNEKKRFAFDESGTRIRANQGHSVDIELGLASKVPPEYLFHGTSVANLASIEADGLKKGDRNHVHLSTDIATVLAVGRRHGTPIVLKISALQMQVEGYQFFVSENNVWLTDFVPATYLKSLNTIND